MAYTETLECSVEVEFRFGLDRGWRGESDEIVDLRATLIGPRGERLECPPWFVGALNGNVIDELYQAATEADYQARADRADADREAAA